jgi:hypothetical protein
MIARQLFRAAAAHSRSAIVYFTVYGRKAAITIGSQQKLIG